MANKAVPIAVPFSCSMRSRAARGLALLTQLHKSPDAEGQRRILLASVSSTPCSQSWARSTFPERSQLRRGPAGRCRPGIGAGCGGCTALPGRPGLPGQAGVKASLL